MLAMLIEIGHKTPQHTFLNERGAVSIAFKEVQKYTIWKERSLLWIFKGFSNTYELGLSIKHPKYFKCNIS